MAEILEPTEQIGYSLTQKNEPENKQNKSSRTPEGQNSEIPLGWKPTMAEPIPVFRCSFEWGVDHPKYGKRCNRYSLRGTTVCLKHGAQLPSVQEHAAAVVEAGLLRLINHSDAFIDVIFDLSKNSDSDAVRLGAAKDGLDRAGLKPGTNINVTVETKVDAAEVLLSKLLAITQRNKEEEIVDAEVVE